MMVRMQHKGLSITGVHIGISNVRRHFRSRVEAVELELDHLRILCNLEASFWRDRPEISDPRLCAWLEEKFFRHSVPKPVLVEMVRAGDSYRLQVHRSARQKAN